MRMNEMTREQFVECLSAYGADFGRWPEDRRDAGRKILDHADDLLLAIYRKESAFDDFLAPSRVDPTVSIDLETRLLASAPFPSSQTSKRAGLLGWIQHLRAPRWVSAGLVGACLMGGAGTGFGVAVAENRAQEAETMMAFAVLPTTSMFEEWTLEAETAP